mgnify:CR=1 FL=1
MMKKKTMINQLMTATQTVIQVMKVTGKRKRETSDETSNVASTDVREKWRTSINETVLKKSRPQRSMKNRTSTSPLRRLDKRPAKTTLPKDLFLRYSHAPSVIVRAKALNWR